MKLDINYNSSKHEVSVDPKFTISKVKSELEGIIMIPAKMMILQFEDKILSDNLTLSEYEIQNGDELTLTLREGEGGCFDTQSIIEYKNFPKMNEK